MQGLLSLLNIIDLCNKVAKIMKVFMNVSSDVNEKAKAASSAVLAFIGSLYADSEFISECGFDLFETYVNKASKARKFFESFVW